VAPPPYRATQVVDVAGPSWGGGALDPVCCSSGVLDPDGCATWWSSATSGHTVGSPTPELADAAAISLSLSLLLRQRRRQRVVGDGTRVRGPHA
jgi:hypothetical protein